MITDKKEFVAGVISSGVLQSEPLLIAFSFINHLGNTVYALVRRGRYRSTDDDVARTERSGDVHRPALLYGGDYMGSQPGITETGYKWLDGITFIYAMSSGPFAVQFSIHWNRGNHCGDYFDEDGWIPESSLAGDQLGKDGPMPLEKAKTAVYKRIHEIQTGNLENAVAELTQARNNLDRLKNYGLDGFKE